MELKDIEIRVDKFDISIRDYLNVRTSIDMEEVLFEFEKIIKKYNILNWEHKTLEEECEDLKLELSAKNDELEELKKDVEENYKRINPAEQYGISDDDFI